MLDILPVKDDGMTSCFDVQLEALGLWKNVGYELMFLDNWKFTFAEEGVKKDGIWKRGKIAPRLYFDDQLKTVKLFQEYHGVTTNFHNIEMKDFAEIADMNLNYKKAPVLAAVDTFYLPWLEKFYQKIHSDHYIMVIGKTDKGYLVNDTRPFLLEPIHGQSLSFARMACSFRNLVIDFEFKEVKYSFQDICSELGGMDLNMFRRMHDFSDFLKQNEIEKEDMENFGGGNGILIRAFRNIIRCRMHFLLSLKYINHNFVEVNQTIQAFDHIIEKWTIMKNFLYKSYISNCYSQINKKLAFMIDEIADYEEGAALEFIADISKVIM